MSSNVLSDEEMDSIWVPYVIYMNTDDNEAVKVNHKLKDVKTIMAISREGSFTRSSFESVDEIELFKEALRFWSFFAKLSPVAASMKLSWLYSHLYPAR